MEEMRGKAVVLSVSDNREALNARCGRRKTTLRTCRSYWAASMQLNSPPANQHDGTQQRRRRQTKQDDVLLTSSTQKQTQLRGKVNAGKVQATLTTKGAGTDRSATQAGAGQLSIEPACPHLLCIIPNRRMGPSACHAAGGTSSASKPGSSPCDSRRSLQPVVLVLHPHASRS
jgi:hypothetical protein